MKKTKKECCNVVGIQKKSMQDFKGLPIYDCIVLRYAIGYLDDDQASTVLEKFGTYLKSYGTKNARKAKRGSFILVQDQILPLFAKEIFDEGQRVRQQKTLLKIFEQANLEIFEESMPEELHTEMEKVKIWALYPKDM